MFKTIKTIEYEISTEEDIEVFDFGRCLLEFNVKSDDMDKFVQIMISLFNIRITDLIGAHRCISEDISIRRIKKCQV